MIDVQHGLKIKGTRRTVFHVLDYHQLGWHPSSIALVLQLSSAQVQEAFRYLETHREEVEAEYAKIVERSRRGHPPEVQSKLDAIHAKYKVLWADRMNQFPEAWGADGENGDARSAGRP